MTERGPERGPEPGAEPAGEAIPWLPASASVVALVRERGGGAWSAGVAAGLADLVGRRRGRTFLACTVPGAEELDGLMDAVDAPGLTRSLAGDLPLSRAARSAPRQAFAYLPAGARALPLGRLREVPAFHRLLRRVAERGGTVLLYVAEEDLAGEYGPDPDFDLPLDGCIAIGDVKEPALLAGAPLLARVERPAGAPRPGAEAEAMRAATGPGDAAAAGEGRAAGGAAAPEGRAGATDRPPRRRFGWQLPIVVAVFAVGAVLAWALLAGGSGDGDGAPEGAVVADASGPGEAGGPSAGRAAAGADAADDPDPGEGPAEFAPPELPAGPAAPELPYSVLIASFARPEDAARQLREGGRAAALFVAPTPIRGRVYYRVLAGARAERTAGESLMRELVEAGHKERARAWDVRPVGLAWLVGVFHTADEGRAAVRRLEEAGLSPGIAYVVPAGEEGQEVYALYAGAFESEEAAAPLGEMLRAAGQEPRLVSRRGRPW
ncbi:MAG: hypothetical protein RRA92_04355 [Gemmatimonadota bacterium]|nr:hypothetical protein [Gemmatimonadota bacterium]